MLHLDISHWLLSVGSNEHITHPRITNDFGPRAGGIETFVIGLIERLPKNSVIVYTATQAGSEPFDKSWLENYGVEVIRDKSKILLPTFRVGRAVRALAREKLPPHSLGQQRHLPC
jgi:phosphatidylinositol alpha-1,6-mannosyltransferase